MITLRAFDKRDFDILIGWVPSRDALHLWAGPLLFRFPLDHDQLEDYRRRAERDDHEVYSAVAAEGVVGHVELARINRNRRRADVCRVVVAPSSRGRGVAGHMLEALIRRAFHELGLDTLELHVHEGNKSAISCYQKVGFEIVNGAQVEMGDPPLRALTMRLQKGKPLPPV